MAVEELHRISPEEYRRLVDAGVFDEDARIELIDGLLLDMSPKTRAHEKAITWLNRWLITAVDPARFEVRIAAPLTLAASEPEPDLAVIPLTAPQPNHPATAELIIEVAVSSQQRDLVQKPPVYARAGVSAYWVIDLDRRCAMIHSTAEDGRYSEVAEVWQGELVAPSLGLTLSLSELFAAAAR